MKYSFSLFLLLICIACTPQSTETAQVTSQPIVGNPAAPGFDEKGSDPKAIAIADQVMEAMGGRKAWDETQVIEWNFFGSRTLIWNKKSDQVQIDIPQKKLSMDINLKDLSGKLNMDGVTVTAPDSLAKYGKMAKSIWINDSYWLVMPFKLKDSGVTLTYVGVDTLPGGLSADVLALTFKEVGDTPQNKYKVYVEKETHLIRQWAFFRDANANQEKPDFVTPWDDYQQYGGILLSGDRGKNKLTGITVR